ncbi:hypothetical protein DH2020_019277 [Rehmannia glutinosa]|uniref:Zinc knuckle CX2CX4HX4C domain-containing protein n=1 Tax=Rehmannia glutinosa TaxID=99300 RepID=A0ABR0WQN1_REHGL
MKESVGKQLVNFVGKFVEYDGNNNSAIWRAYMRIKVEIDVRLPLKRFKKIRRLEGDWTIVSFKYERLGVFCYICGLMGHGEQFCEKRLSITEGDTQKDWGLWLRAPNKRYGSREGEKWLCDECEDMNQKGDGPSENFPAGDYVVRNNPMADLVSQLNQEGAKIMGQLEDFQEFPLQTVTKMG